MQSEAISRPRRRRGLPATLLRLAITIALLVVILPYVLVLLYRGGEPTSTLMMWRSLTGAHVQREWRALPTISPALPRAVIASEDAKFCFHSGIDWDSMRDVMEDLQDGEAARGGSTITMQVAKNLFLWPYRSYVRKALEFPLSLWIDLVLPKARIMELYLNVAEWGPSNQFGAEAAARYAFGKSAAQLSGGEAALLAAILPNPVTRSARRPGPGVRRIAGTVAARAIIADSSCLRGARDA
jgi:monofunctional biosynthetic peptidoglycan transglycosylase